MSWSTRLPFVALVFAALLYEINLEGGLSRLTYDSFRYLAGAESIIHSGSYLDISGDSQRIWPPGTSLMLAGVMLSTGFDYDASTRFIGIISTLITAIALLAILRRAIERYWLVLLAFTAFILNIGFLSLQQKLLSDPMALALALGSMSCAMRALAAEHKRWPKWLVAASVLLSLAIVFRFSMIGAMPVLLAVSLWCSTRDRSFHSVAVLPLLTPLPQFICFRLLGVPALGARVSEFRPLALSDDFEAIIRISDQFFPVSITSKGIALSGYFTIAIILPILATIIEGNTKRTIAIWVSIGFISCYLIFILMAQSVAAPGFKSDFRILFPILPFSIIALSVATDSLMSNKATGCRFLAVVLLSALTLTAGRAARAATLTAFADEPVSTAQCTSRKELVRHIRTVVNANERPRILSNSQGQAWYALRSEVEHMTVQAIKSAPARSLLIYTKPTGICEYVENYPKVNEEVARNINTLERLFETDKIIVFEKK